MTPLEIIGIIALGAFVGRIVYRATHRDPMILLSDALSQTEKSVREAFQAGMLCAADIATHEGSESTAGVIRKVVEGVRASDDS